MRKHTCHPFVIGPRHGSIAPDEPIAALGGNGAVFRRLEDAVTGHLERCSAGERGRLR